MSDSRYLGPYQAPKRGLKPNHETSRGTNIVKSSEDSTPSPARQARIAEIRGQIKAGTYETYDKLEAAVEALRDALERDERYSV